MPPVPLRDAQDFLPIALDNVAHTLVTKQSIDFSLTRLEPIYPDLVRAVRECIGPTVLVQAVRRLAADRVHLGRLQNLLDAALESRGASPADGITGIVLSPRPSRLFAAGGAFPHVSPVDVLVENIRAASARRISLEAGSTTGPMHVYTLDAAFEAELAALEVARIEPHKTVAFVRTLADRVDGDPSIRVVLTSCAASRHVAWMLGPTLPDLTVVAVPEMVTGQIEATVPIEFS